MRSGTSNSQGRAEGKYLSFANRHAVAGLVSVTLMAFLLYSELNKFASSTVKLNDAVVSGSVPHGEVHHHFYKSEVASGLPGEERDYYVYTPPGYDQKGYAYPTLYLLHGSAQTAADWTLPGEANFILDNLIAQGKAKPMIVVMPLGYGGQDVLAKTILTEILPQVESEYHVVRKRDDRAIAGLSLGGAESLDIAFHHADLFGWVGSFSAGTAAALFHSTHPLPIDAQRANFHLLWIACGKDDDLLKANRDLIAELKQSNFSPTAVETPGAHTWTVWHDDLVHFASLLFQGKQPG